MGLMDLFAKTVDCPFCGTKQARKAGSHVRCLNADCPYFDPKLVAPGQLVPGTGRPLTLSASGEQVAVRYTNFEGKQRSFVADRDSIIRKHNHLSIITVPKRMRSMRIALSRDRIQNLAEVEQYAKQQVPPGAGWPTPRERQVLNYHKKHGTTSPLYESVRKKYPNW